MAKKAKGDGHSMRHESTQASSNVKWQAGYRCGVATAALVFAMGAQAVDVDAGDYTALPAGTNLGIIYYQHAERDKLYSSGDKVPINAKLDSDVGILRGVHFMDIGGYIVDPQFLLPFGHLRGRDDLSALGSGSGVADLLLAATVWTVNRPMGSRPVEGEEGTFLGITPFVWVPIGTYDHNKALNLGEHRWKYALQVGYIRVLSSNWILDLIADVTAYGKNDDLGSSSATLKQDPTFQGQAYLRYRFDDKLSAYGGLSYSAGGETRINNVNQHDRISTGYWRLGAQYFFAPTVQGIVGVGSDTNVRNGLKENFRINFRLLKAF